MNPEAISAINQALKEARLSIAEEATSGSLHTMDQVEDAAALHNLLTKAEKLMLGPLAQQELPIPKGGSVHA